MWSPPIRPAARRCTSAHAAARPDTASTAAPGHTPITHATSDFRHSCPRSAPPWHGRSCVLPGAGSSSPRITRARTAGVPIWKRPASSTCAPACGSKPAPRPGSRVDRPACGHECLVIAHQTCKGKAMRKRWNGGGKQGVYWHALTADYARYHPAQKPIGLLRELVADFSDPGELVCDPYAGSGTTGLACAQLGRRFIGWERDVAMAALAGAAGAGSRLLIVRIRLCSCRSPSLRRTSRP